jgi:hypothetical protein
MTTEPTSGHLHAKNFESHKKVIRKALNMEETAYFSPTLTPGGPAWEDGKNEWKE